MSSQTMMNTHTPSRRNRPGRSGPRRGLALAALAAVAMLAAACGGKSPSGATGSTQYQKALAFSRCMRAHGALGFPDPTSAGTITVTQALLNNPQVKPAAQSCQNLLPRGAVQVPPALLRKLETEALRYSACMRSHGVTNFPDPIIHDGSIGYRMAAQSPAGGAKSSSGSGPKPSTSSPPPVSPQMRAAEQACHGLLPGFK